MFSKLAYAAATPYNWSRYAISSVLGRDQMEALARQLEEMKSQLQRAEENGSFQERKVRELSGNLEHETTENKTLWDQVQYLTNELGKERDGRKRHVDLYRQEILKNQELNTLNRQLFQQVQDLQSKQACMMSVVNETQTELETLTREYNILCSSYDELNQDHTDLQEKYEMDIIRTLCGQVERLNKKLGQEKELKKQLLCQVEEMKEKNDMDINTEKQRIVTLVEKLEMMEKEIARKISELDHLIYEHQKTEHDTNLLKELVSERDMELEHLKILLHEQTSKNNQVVVQLQTEKDLNGILHAELETLKDQRTFNFSVSQNPEPVDQGSSCDSQNPELVDERSSCDSQNPEPVDKDPLSVSQDTENAVVTTRKPSLWKKTCHFLCLRKKNMQRNVHQHAEFPRVSQDLEPLQESSFSVSQDSVVESGCVTHSPEPVVEDSSTTSEDTDLNAKAEGCDKNAAVTMRKPSLWKQTHRFLGLRKKRRKEMCSSKSPSVSQAQQLKYSEK
ncbi:microtubule organizer protein 1-like isoform X2 [Larimichthys crocea]|uniref:microtubule organizer protein 1-like isoform X2 n=1 Tax=Larimichthys crocea TaxID=215358 RepID=UPI000F5EC1BA|nr:microtubule organizer protein 1-like isoform X2 [Larimichthys crocea]